MGLTLKASGANFEANAISFLPPVPEGLLYWGFPNDSQAKLGRNFAPGGSPLEVVGQPSISAAGVVLDDNNFLKTTILQTSSVSIIAVGNPVAYGASTGMFISNFASPRPNGEGGFSYGVSMYCADEDPVEGIFRVRVSVSRYSGEPGSTSGLNYVSIRGLDIKKPAFLAMTFDATEKVVRGYNLATGFSDQRAPIPDKVDIGTLPFYIGNCPAESFVNNAKHLHFAAIYNRKLSEAELGKIYARIQAYLASRNVII